MVGINILVYVPQFEKKWILATNCDGYSPPKYKVPCTNKLCQSSGIGIGQTTCQKCFGLGYTDIGLILIKDSIVNKHGIDFAIRLLKDQKNTDFNIKLSDLYDDVFAFTISSKLIQTFGGKIYEKDV